MYHSPDLKGMKLRTTEPRSKTYIYSKTSVFFHHFISNDESDHALIIDMDDLSVSVFHITKTLQSRAVLDMDDEETRYTMCMISLEMRNE